MFAICVLRLYIQQSAYSLRRRFNDPRLTSRSINYFIDSWRRSEVIGLTAQCAFSAEIIHHSRSVADQKQIPQATRSWSPRGPRSPRNSPAWAKPSTSKCLDDFSDSVLNLIGG